MAAGMQEFPISINHLLSPSAIALHIELSKLQLQYRVCAPDVRLVLLLSVLKH